MTQARPPSATASAISRYRFAHRLAVGGMAEIYVADAAGAAGVTRRVAIKRILPVHASDAVFVHMFVNEARVASTLQHPNIVQTYDVIDDGGVYNIVMELLQGLNLLDLHRHLYERKLGFTVRQALYIIDRVLAGLHYAHERKIHDGTHLEVVHRDVSPHNIFLTADGGVKLLDFGVAKAAAMLDKRGTESGVVKGKVLYMSPEQCQGLEVDRRTDVWAAGVLLYVLLTGRTPFKGKNPYDTMRAIIHDHPASPSMRVPELGVELDAIVLQALAKPPGDRFQTARDMQRAVGEVVRRNGWYLSELEFTAFVEGVLQEMPPREPDLADLPRDIVIAEGGTEQLARFSSAAPEEATGPRAETEHAVVEQVGGLTVLKLRGTIDEKFDPDALVPHLEGVVVIDSDAVGRVTSYGIRGLLKLYEGAAGRMVGVYHIRCSVALVQQFGMIRRLLGGGKVLSFQLPYVDPSNGHAFVELAAGAAAEDMLRARKAPRVPCPGFPDRLADFDEDETAYLGFLEDFLATPPAHIATVLDALAGEERRRQVEKAVTATGTDVWIRRPIDEAYRWANMLSGMEGDLRIDMSATPSWSSAGVSQLVGALARESEPITSLTLSHMPAPLYQQIAAREPLVRLLRPESTVRLHATCAACRAPRRVAVELAAMAGTRVGTQVEVRCPACGGVLTSTDDLATLVPASARVDAPPSPARPAAPPPRVRSGRVSGTVFWSLVVLAWLLLIGLAMLLAALVLANTFL